jgi:hypothetical protein
MADGAKSTQPDCDPQTQRPKKWPLWLGQLRRDISLGAQAAGGTDTVFIRWR